MNACILCGASATDALGNVKHEAPCPHFMRGPDPGGDPAEWPTLLDGLRYHVSGAIERGEAEAIYEVRAEPNA